MLQNKTIVVAGGDLRQAQLARLLREHNRVYTIGLEKAEGLEDTYAETAALKQEPVPPDYIILPVPAGSDEDTVNTPFSGKRLPMEDLLELAGPDTLVLGGKLSEGLRQKLEARKLAWADYLQREELAVLNAIPTAEGTVQIAMEELPSTIFGLQALVIGYGRIGRVLCRMLRGLGAHVTAAARKYADLAWIEADGCTPVHTGRMEEALKDSQLIVNTAPAMLLNEQLLKGVPKSCLLIDLASKPGGIDFNTANRLGLKAIWALSLPGKVAPLTAGRIIFDTIQNIAAERGEGHGTDEAGLCNDRQLLHL